MFDLYWSYLRTWCLYIFFARGEIPYKTDRRNRNITYLHYIWYYNIAKNIFFKTILDLFLQQPHENLIDDGRQYMYMHYCIFNSEKLPYMVRYGFRI